MTATFTLPPFLVDALWRSLSPHAMTAPHFIVGGREDPYLRRWHIAPRGEGPSCYLHEFLRSDDDRALHDHPYESVSIILRRGYLEHVPGQAVPIRRNVGDVVLRDATTPHRVELLAGPAGTPPISAWTLFLTGPRVRDWGFHCPNGWVPWQVFTDARDAGAIGRGCD